MDLLLKYLQQCPRAGWQWTLDAAGRTWSPANALALANCALLAYSDAGTVDAHLLARGFDAVMHCPSDEYWINTRAYVGARTDACILVFRGTEPTRLRDLLTDFNVRQVPFETVFGHAGWGRIHEGFAAGTAAVLAGVRRALAACGAQDRPLYITGHSLGGAMAVIAAAVLACETTCDTAGVYTFGQPRAGDPVFRDRYDAVLRRVTSRCVNDRDLVPHLPPRDLSAVERALASPRWNNVAEAASALVHNSEPRDYYEHVGQLRLLLAEGAVTDDPAEEAARQPELLSGTRFFADIASGLPAFIRQSPRLIREHFPIGPDRRDGYVDRIEALLR